MYLIKYKNTDNKKNMSKELKKWKKEKRLIPVMIRKYCHGKHKTKRRELCEDCQKLTEYALFRLEKCPFKVNKGFCSFCKIHCYQPEMKEKIKAVMKYSGPRMLPMHPIFSISHVIQMLQYKKKIKKEENQSDR
ncbi:MAG: nitrous oxide-stimulated promoter family protein [Anaeroplasmataceae bacterium]|nr:nitrous oxide-stimulated promoter family protein [Anaeroplasmataceae bacterium]